MVDAGGNGSRARDQWRAGAVLAERYRLEAELGSGSFGVVWRARHVHLDSECAVKIFDPPPGADLAEAGARFLQEARVMARLKCPHVAQVFDYGVHEQMPFLALELLLGSSLGTHLAELRAQGRCMPAAETARIIRHIAEGLNAAHSVQVVHRDLKPENIFIAQHGESYVAKVLDFGIAKWTADGAPRMTTTRTVMGTPYYMSPEQFEGAQNADHRSDLWSLGVIAFECLTGQLPFQGDTFIDIAFRVCKQGPLIASQLAEVPQGFDGWFAQATALRPQYRFASALELASALESVCAAPLPAVPLPNAPLPAVPLPNAPLRVAALAPSPEQQPRPVARNGGQQSLRRGWKAAAILAASAVLLGGAHWLGRASSGAPPVELPHQPQAASAEAEPPPTAPPATQAGTGALQPQAREPAVQLSPDRYGSTDEALLTRRVSESGVAEAHSPTQRVRKIRTSPPKSASTTRAESTSVLPAPAPAPSDKLNCKQPFWIDEKGIRRLKMTCL